jgi:two-component system phosphate regulon response regulator PhoB
MSGVVRVLVIEDEAPIQELLCYSLEQAGFEVTAVTTAEQGLAEIRSELPSVVLLDLMLPGMSGVALAKQLRSDARTRDLPLIMVTARAEESDRVGGLDVGADDYVTKPFSQKELVSRIRAVLRRRAPHQAGNPVEIGGVRLDPSAHTVTVEGRPVDLGPTEFKLLQYLMHHPNRAMTREQLLNILRGDHAALLDRTVDVYVRRLRAALGPAGEALIETIRGTGYKLTSPAE